MLKEGIVIGERYEIISRVGSGGMADVYKAKDHKLSRMVAVKVLKAEFRADTTFVSKFQKEAQAAAGLSHPNVVNVFDVGEDRGLYYIVMELVEGITLKDYITKKGKLSVKEATSIAIQVSLGLEAAHNEGIVHRDVKPQNIIISTDGKVKLSDFGIAKAINSNTITANVMGSVHYSSPEQVRGGFSDTKSDIYSLGITMYEMVTGRVPFDGDTTVAIAIKHLQEEMIAPSRFTPDLPFSLEQIILKCTQKNPERRYAYIGDLIEDLKKSLVDPQGNFVQLSSLNNNARTVMASAAETETIRRSAQNVQKTSRNAKPQKTQKSQPEYKPEEEYKEDAEEEYSRSRRDMDDDDGSDVVSSRLEKAITIGGFLIGAVIIIILIVVIGNMAGLFKKKSTTGTTSVSTTSVSVTSQSSAATIQVPDFSGMTLAEAQEVANSYGIGVKQTGTQESDVPEGQVVSQEIAAGEKVEPNTTIGVVISSGSSTVTIPTGLVGATQTDATNTLSAAGLSATIVMQSSNDVESGTVISTDPAEGAAVLPGTTVTLTVSSGPDGSQVTIPNTLVGMQQSEAEAVLQQLGLAVNTNTTKDTSKAEGVVTAIYPAAGTQVEVGSSVTLTVNSLSGGDDTEATWVSSVSLPRPENYNGGTVTITLRQQKDEASYESTTTVYSGGDLWTDGNYYLTVNGVANIQIGYLDIYEDGVFLQEVVLPFAPQ